MRVDTEALKHKLMSEPPFSISYMFKICFILINEIEELRKSK